jgi:proprotein convertase subtilisin/kexin type 5
LSSQSTCYVTCPSYYWNATTGPTLVCTSCSQHCLTCVISTLCTLCQPNYYLLGFQQINCTATCPVGYYTNYTDNTCMQCLINCTSCNDLYSCSGCVSAYYLDPVDKLCYNCHVSCMTCTGPGGDQCTTCQYPLFLTNNVCTNLTCSPSNYVDSILGCTPCTHLFANSMTCNSTNVLSCQSTYVMQSNTCISCSLVTGFYLDVNHACREICGDGKLYVLQCDDGNTLDGDGCSSSCNV